MCLPSPLVSLFAKSSLLSKSSQASCTIPLPSCTTMPFLFLAQLLKHPSWALFHLCLFAPWKDQLCPFLVVFARYLSNLKKKLIQSLLDSVSLWFTLWTAWFPHFPFSYLPAFYGIFYPDHFCNISFPKHIHYLWLNVHSKFQKSWKKNFNKFPTNGILY